MTLMETKLYAAQHIDADPAFARLCQRNIEDIQDFVQRPLNEHTIKIAAHSFDLTPERASACLSALHRTKKHATRLFEFLVETGIFGVNRLAGFLEPLESISTQQLHTYQDRLIQAAYATKEGQRVPQRGGLRRKMLKALQKLELVPAETPAQPVKNTRVHADIDRSRNLRIQAVITGKHAEALMGKLEVIMQHYSCTLSEAVEKLLSIVDVVPEQALPVSPPPMNRRARRQRNRRRGRR